MKINEYGNRDKPHIILIHGMWMCHELMLPYVAPFKDDYHIIAPNLTGHGNDKGQFISAEKDAEELASWLSANGMREIDLMFSSSLGGVVAMYLATSKEDIHIKCNVMEGASLTRVPLIEPLFRIMMDGIRKNPEKIAKMYASMPMTDESIQTKLYNAMKRTDEQALRNMVHTCNSFDFENRSLDEKKQRTLVFEFGSRDSHIVCRGDIKKFYPGASIMVRKGYGHCTYMFSHINEYPGILKNYMMTTNTTE